MRKLIFILAFFLFPLVSFSQFYGYKFKGGINFNYLYPTTELTSDEFSFLGRGFFNIELHKMLSLEIGGGYGRMRMTDELTHYPGAGLVESEIIPVDLRLRFNPWSYLKSVNPYFYAGGGVIRYVVLEGENSYVGEGENVMYVQKEKKKVNGWAAITPVVGAGIEIKLAKNVLLDIQLGWSYYTSDYVNNNNWANFNDGNFHGGIGFTFCGERDADDDKDGLLTSFEEEIGTDPFNPDTDGDGLKDGQEVNTYKTNPLLPDTDDDGLNDYLEVMKHKTNPTNPDTDGDGLKDGEEVNKYYTDPLMKDTDNDGLTDFEEVKTTKTDPIRPDTDGDGLYDGEEVNVHKTNPLKPDSDEDELNDYEEVKKYKTKPLKADTDAGTINDGIEVRRGTNPLDPSDDVVKEEIKVGEVVVLEGVNFETNSSRITPESETILQKTLEYMKKHPEEKYEISGHTDSRGSREKNMRLSQERAEAVKNWLVEHGIDESRLTAVGYGPDMPIVPNTSEENMYKNRRVEFKRIK
ncbi:MAG: OmpA family protein [Ignavibacteria bacterium]|nr:OmpA family protein [Ignavibacteria bacterium]